MSTIELEAIVTDLVKEKNLKTLQDIVADGIQVDNLPYGRDPVEKILACVEHFPSKYLGQKVIDLNLLKFIYRNTTKLPSYSLAKRDNKATIEELNYQLAERFIRNDQAGFKAIWFEFPSTQLDVSIFQKYVSDLVMTADEMQNASCCLAFLKKKNRITSQHANEIEKILENKKVDMEQTLTGSMSFSSHKP